MGLFSKRSPEATFWKWFAKHDDRLFSFEADQDAIFQELGKAINKIHPDLTFEFGPVSEAGKREFIISAGGDHLGVSSRRTAR